MGFRVSQRWDTEPECAEIGSIHYEKNTIYLPVFDAYRFVSLQGSALENASSPLENAN